MFIYRTYIVKDINVGENVFHCFRRGIFTHVGVKLVN